MRKTLRVKVKDQSIFMDRWPDVKLKKMIETGEPKYKGAYLCFYKTTNDAWDWMPMAHSKVAFWDGMKWHCGEQILGHIGPLPNMAVDEVHELWPEETPLIMFFIGTKTEAKSMNFSDGPFYRIFNSCAVIGEKGQYIFCIDSRKTKAIPFFKWSPIKNKWISLPAEKRMREQMKSKGKLKKESPKELKPKKMKRGKLKRKRKK